MMNVLAEAAKNIRIVAEETSFCGKFKYLGAVEVEIYSKNAKCAHFSAEKYAKT